MPTKGKRIAERRYWRYSVCCAAHTPNNSKRPAMCGMTYKEVEKKLNEARANAGKGLVLSFGGAKCSAYGNQDSEAERPSATSTNVNVGGPNCASWPRPLGV
jgi:hypothetical protein